MDKMSKDIRQAKRNCNSSKSARKVIKNLRRADKQLKTIECQTGE